MLMLIDQISLSKADIVPGKMVIHLIWKAISVMDYDKVVKNAYPEVVTLKRMNRNKKRCKPMREVYKTRLE